VTQADGSVTTVDRSDEILDALRRERIDAVVAVGGDGSLSIAAAFARKGLRVVGVPKTIDNDLDGTVITFGFDTAVSFATECLDRLHSTATAHRRARRFDHRRRSRPGARTPCQWPTTALWAAILRE
jgi:6-phosphofructokinase 1